MVALAEQARQRDACPNVRFVVGDVLAAPFADGAFDVVVSDCALHDMPLDAALITIRRLVRPGGRLMLRDLVTRSSRLAQSPAYQLLRTVRKAPAYVKRHGPQTAWRLLKFEAHPAWLRHRASGLRLTPAAFEARYGQVFPGGRFVHFGWASAVFWIRPKNEDTL
jgi:ubiquinone/menaquinone biosynthesis C-methylase UbiE